MLNNLVIIQKKIKTGPLENEKWEDEFSLWVDIKSIKIEKISNANRTFETKVITMKIRKSIKTKSINYYDNRIKYDSKPYKIESIIEDAKDRNYIKLECREV